MMQNQKSRLKSRHITRTGTWKLKSIPAQIKSPTYYMFINHNKTLLQHSSSCGSSSVLLSSMRFCQILY